MKKPAHTRQFIDIYCYTDGHEMVCVSRLFGPTKSLQISQADGAQRFKNPGSVKLGERLSKPDYLTKGRGRILSGIDRSG